MFGHLKADEFVNVLEDAALPANRHAHVRSCARCGATLASMQAIQTNLKTMTMADDENYSEPDWSDFRTDVRNTLLSRSVKRDAAGRSWHGWAVWNWRPAMAWSLSAMLVLGLTVLTLRWNPPAVNPILNPSVDTETLLPLNISAESLAEPGAAAELAGLGETDVFEALVRLNADEAESLLSLLKDMTQKDEIR